MLDVSEPSGSLSEEFLRNALGGSASGSYDGQVADSKRALVAVREELSGLDAALVDLLDKRARLVRRLGEARGDSAAVASGP